MGIVTSRPEDIDLSRRAFVRSRHHREPSFAGFPGHGPQGTFTPGEHQQHISALPGGTRRDHRAAPAPSGGGRLRGGAGGGRWSGAVFNDESGSQTDVCSCCGLFLGCMMRGREGEMRPLCGWSMHGRRSRREEREIKEYERGAEEYERARLGLRGYENRLDRNGERVERVTVEEKGRRRRDEVGAERARLGLRGYSNRVDEDEEKRYRGKYRRRREEREFERARSGMRDYSKRVN